MPINDPTRLKIIWRFDTSLSNCYFVVSLGPKGLVQFSSPELKHRRQLTSDEIERVKKLVKRITPRPIDEDGPFTLICPEIESELQICGDGWSFKYRWTNGSAKSAPENFGPLAELGGYIMEILPVQDMGIEFPLHE